MEDYITKLIIIFCVSLLIALIAVLIMKRGMNTARSKNNAKEYYVQNSFNLKESRDIFLYSSVTKTPRPKNDNNSSHKK